MAPAKTGDVYGGDADLFGEFVASNLSIGHDSIKAGNDGHDETFLNKQATRKILIMPR